MEINKEQLLAMRELIDAKIEEIDSRDRLCKLVQSNSNAEWYVDDDYNIHNKGNAQDAFAMFGEDAIMSVIAGLV
jgi:hypothetical protein